MTVRELLDDIDQLRKAGVLTLDAQVQVVVYRPDKSGYLCAGTLAAGHQDQGFLTIYAEAGGDFPL
jgi:hypothetical protein